jgi:hypothetical protein
MSLIPFYSVERDLAARETRVINTLVVQDGLPIGSYGLFEFYCPDPACNCRRVMLNVVEEKHPDHFLASISYAFDRDDDMAGPFLDPLNPQSRYARKLLQLVEDIVLSDPRYVARLERHYAIVKRAASDPEHPAYSRLQTILAEEEASFPEFQPASSAQPVPRNAPCPCGSGKKYKHCCMRKGRE